MSTLAPTDDRPVTTTRSERRRPFSARFDVKNSLALVFLFAFSSYFLLPIYWLIISSTKDNGELFTSNGFWFAHFNLISNIQQTFAHADGVFGHWLINTVIYAFGAAGISTLFATMAGYALAKYRFRGRALIFAIILGAILVPGTALALPLYLMLSKWSLTNTYWSVLLPQCISPLGVYLARIYAQSSVPDDLLDAARVDGAGEFRIFASVALRIMSPVLVTSFLFQFVAVWNNYFLPQVMLSDPNLFPMNLGLQTWDLTPADHEVVYNLIITGAAISVVPLIIAFIFLQRYWRSGLTLGSVTG